MGKVSQIAERENRDPLEVMNDFIALGLLLDDEMEEGDSLAIQRKDGSISVIPWPRFKADQSSK